MDRRAELLSIVQKYGEQAEIEGRQLVEEIIFLEKQLEEKRKLPFLSVNPKNKLKQKATPAAKLYKELLQQYNNCLRMLDRIVGSDGDTEAESPLRQWAKNRQQ